MRFNPGCACCALTTCTCVVCGSAGISSVLHSTFNTACSCLPSGGTFAITCVAGGSGWGGSIFPSSGLELDLTFSCVTIGGVNYFKFQISAYTLLSGGGTLLRWTISSTVALGGGNTCSPINVVFNFWSVDYNAGGDLSVDCANYASLIVTVTI